MISLQSYSFILKVFLDCVFGINIKSRSKIKCTFTISESEVDQLCPTLCDPMDCSLPGSSLHGILQARVLEWVAISFSRGSSWPRDRTQVSRIPGRCFNLWATREPLFLPPGYSHQPHPEMPFALPQLPCSALLFPRIFSRNWREEKDFTSGNDWLLGEKKVKAGLRLLPGNPL